MAKASVAPGSTPPCFSASESLPRVATDTNPVIITPIAMTKMTAVVPTSSEIRPTTMIGRKLAIETSIPSTPNTRPRTSSGRSSWSCVWDGMATSP